MKMYFKNVYYRAASTIATTLTKGGTYPDYTFSGLTRLVGGMATLKTGVEPDGEEPQDGGATTYVSGEKSPVEIVVNNFSAANYATIRAAFKNVKVDVFLYDPDQPAVAYGIFGTCLYPASEFGSGEEPKITIKGERKYGSGVKPEPFQVITVS